MGLVKNKVKNILIILLGVLVLGLVLYLGVKFSVNFFTREKTLKLGLADAGELVTQTCYTTVLEDSKVNRDFFKLFDIPFTESRQIFSYDFEVDASLDFSSIEYKVNDKKKEINVILPHSRVYNVTFNPSSLKVYLDSESLFSRIDLEKHNSAVEKMQEQAENDCVANKVLESADINAERLLEGFIKGEKKYKDYSIVFNYVGGN